VKTYRIIVECTATVEETWELKMPDHYVASCGPDAELGDVLMDLLGHGEPVARFVSDRVAGGERDRTFGYVLEEITT
jgi:hypothetical protein